MRDDVKMPSAQKKAHAMYVALSRANLFEHLKRQGVEPAIVVTHDEMAELLTNAAFCVMHGPQYRRNIRLYNIRVCEED